MLPELDRYTILEMVGKGGQGTVYRAQDNNLGRIVALKVIDQPVDDDPLYLEALRREAQLAASLDHPNVTKVHDFQVENGIAFIVMEFVPYSLDKLIRGGQRLSWREAFRIALQLCGGLEHAHAKKEELL